MNPRFDPEYGGEDDADRADTEDVLPDGTKCVMTANPLHVTVDERWFDLGHFELESGEIPDRVMFEAGDEIPLDLAAICWSAFQDRLSSLDGHGVATQCIRRARCMHSGRGGQPTGCIQWGGGAGYRARQALLRHASI